MLSPISSSQFKRDVRKSESRGKQMDKLRTLLALLIEENPLPQTYRDHQLKGNWNGHREAHIEPDWLLIYRIDGTNIHLTRTGTHSDLFDL